MSYKSLVVGCDRKLAGDELFFPDGDFWVCHIHKKTMDLVHGFEVIYCNKKDISKFFKSKKDALHFASTKLGAKFFYICYPNVLDMMWED